MSNYVTHNTDHFTTFVNSMNTAGHKGPPKEEGASGGTTGPLVCDLFNVERQYNIIKKHAFRGRG